MTLVVFWRENDFAAYILTDNRICLQHENYENPQRTACLTDLYNKQWTGNIEVRLTKYSQFSGKPTYMAEP